MAVGSASDLTRAGDARATGGARGESDEELGHRADHVDGVLRLQRRDRVYVAP